MDSVNNVLSKSQILEQIPDDFGYADDRISDLSDDILLRILSYLPTKDIIATCALSSRWKILWKSLHLRILDFDFEVDSQVWRPKWNPSVVVDWDTVQRQVEQIPDRARIRKFLLKWIKNRWRSAITKKRNEWNSLLSKLVRHEVEVLDLCIDPEWGRFRFLPWPDSFCTSDSLTTLKLDMSLQLHLPASICFPRLKTLHLKRIIFHQKNDPERLFSACPKLEELLFRRCALISNHPPNHHHELGISISSLRRLIFEHGSVFEPDTYVSLRINCSNLQSLEFDCFKFQLLECNLPSLTEVDIPNWKYSPHGLELFERIRHVKSLRLSAQTIEGIIFERLHLDDNLTMKEVVSFYFNRSLKSFTISKFYGNELEVNVCFHIPSYVTADVHFVGKILENADVFKELKMEKVEREVYMKEKLLSFSYTDCDLF
ncbi:hypothetical protein COLO4_29031 [Corchorus olitorius]|uniref:F-box domain-containing protein n=1 Tax=Corchorus olitorius TaxID=93759 RepID=A0A1R3HGK6_9ROSI|nr:hypothetical protein COLO4_29031 [Corchorus olitorius]